MTGFGLDGATREPLEEDFELEVCESVGATGADNGDITAFEELLELALLAVAVVVVEVTAVEGAGVLDGTVAVVDVTGLEGAAFLLLATRCLRPLLALGVVG